MPATALHGLLRSQCAPMEFKIQLTLPSGEFDTRLLLDLFARLREEGVRRFDTHARDALEVLESVEALHHLARWAAASITVSEEHERAVGHILVLEVSLGIVQLLHGHIRSVGIGGREMREDRCAVYPLPQEGMVRELGGVVPGDLLGQEPMVSGAPRDLRPRTRIPEAVRKPHAIGIHAQVLTEIPLAKGDLTYEGFTARQHAIGFHPHATHGNEAAFANTPKYLREQIGMVLFKPCVLLRRTHGVHEIGVFIHERQHIGHGARHLAARLPHRPQPRRIDMRVPHCADPHGRGIRRLA